METKHCDLLVMGGGGAGLVAAARAAELNPNIHIIVVEKGNATGGGACQAGVFRVYGSQWQKERGLNDTLAADLRKRMDETFWRIDRKLALNAFLGTGRFFDWCCTLSPDCADRFVPGRYVFDRPDKGPEIPVYVGLPEERKNQPAMPMMPPPDGDDEKGGMPAGMPMPGMRTGTYLMKLMRETCKKDGVEILTKTRITDVTVENGKITGATAEGPDGTIGISCRAVVLATGSWISNPKYLEMASPLFAKMDPGKPVPSGHRNSNYTGDGIPIAEKAGALVDYQSFCIRAMGPGLVGRDGSPIFPRGQMADAMARSPYAIQIDEQGRRYTCEPSGTRFPAEDSAHLVLLHGSTTPYVVFDLNTAKYTAQQAKKQNMGREGGMGGPARVNLEPDQVQADLEREKFMCKGETVEELAEQLGVPAENLAETVRIYNESCKNGFDSDCFKEAEYLIPMTGPFYGFMTALNTDGAFGGAQVNENIQAKAKNGGLVEGLWVPGDFSSSRFINDGGLKRQIINDLAWAFSSGFIAGEQAAEYLK